MPASRIDRILRIVSIVLLVGLAGVYVDRALPRMRSQLSSQETRVAAEIAALEVAAVAFRTRADAFPPSRLILHEQPTRHPYDLGGTTVRARVEQRTLAYFQRVWPFFNAVTGEVDSNDDGEIDIDWIDYNGNGRIDDELELDGAECMVFFLGGVIRNDVPTGFSQNPRHPFDGATRRIGPFMEFDPARLIDRDGDGLREYVDPMPGQKVPYHYFSAYGSATGYNYRVDIATADNGAFQAYFQSGDPDVDQFEVAWFNPNTFQIISPGRDGKIGGGGLFDPRAPDKLPPDDADNLTNFHKGPLRTD